MSTLYSSYKYVVEFDKKLVKGVLNGLTVRDRVHFTSEHDAKSWVQDVQKIDNNSQFTNFMVKKVA